MIIQHHTNANLQVAIRECIYDLLYSDSSVHTSIHCSLTTEMQRYINQQLVEYCDIEPIYFQLRQSIRALYCVGVKHV